MIDPAGTNLPKRIVRNAVQVLAGQVLSLLANLGVTLMLAAYLGGSAFGKFSYALVFVSFFALIADFGMKPILVRELARQPLHRALIFGNALFLKVVLAVIAIFATLVVVLFLDFEGETRALLFILAGIILLSSKVTAFRVLFETVFHAQLRVDVPVLCQLLDSVLLIASLWLLIQKQATLTILALAYLLSSLPGFIVTVVWSWYLLKPEFHINLKLCRSLLQESFPILLYAIFMASYDRFDVLLLEKIQGENSVGLYAAAFRLVSPLNFIPAAFVTAIFPLMAQDSLDSQDRLQKTYLMSMKALGVISLPLALLAGFLGKNLFALLYKSSFIGAANTFSVLMSAQIFFFWIFFLVDFNTSNGRQRINFWISLLMCLLNLGLNLWLVPQWDHLGASMAKFLTSVAGFSALFLLSYKFEYREMGIFSARLCLLALLFALWLYFVRDQNLFVILALSAVMYPLLLWFCHVFDKKEIGLLLRVINRYP